MSKNPSYEDLIQRAETLEKELAMRQQTEEALRKSERRYRTLLDFVPYPLTVIDAQGRVSYVNPGFTDIFGWSLDELKGKIIPFVPQNRKREIIQKAKDLLDKKVLELHETKRLTKEQEVLDVSIRAAYYTTSKDESPEIITILRDITHDKKVARNNEAMLRISLALPKYPKLDELLDYITGEIKGLLNAEGAIVLLLDEEKMELFTLGASYDDKARQKRMMEVRFPTNKLISGKVIKSGKPVIISDTSQEPELHEERDKIMGYKTRNLLSVPLIIGERIIGTLGAINKKEDLFDHTDTELLSMIAGTVALSIENARVTGELQKAYVEVSSMNRAKDKVINHLSHELTTPLAILAGSLKLFEENLRNLPGDQWKSTMDRAKRNLDRVMDIQYEVNDIMLERKSRTYEILNMILDQCVDELETLIAEEVGEGPFMKKIRKKVEDLFGPKNIIPSEIDLADTIPKRIEILKPRFSRRDIRLKTLTEPVPLILLPEEVLEKVFDGIMKNAVENTPDEGEIEIEVRKKGEGAELVVRDYGVGITEEDQRRIFEGFFVTQETMAYSTKRPYDFNAGGKGADLLRMKIFSERYHFELDMKSERCPCLKEGNEDCPGKISLCPHCRKRPDCHEQGGTVFTLYFSPASAPLPNDCKIDQLKKFDELSDEEKALCSGVPQHGPGE
ncbi:MAG: GAF domain-containing protein [Pseudomonadota bacterium]